MLLVLCPRSIARSDSFRLPLFEPTFGNPILPWKSGVQLRFGYSLSFTALTLVNDCLEIILRFLV